MSNVHIVLKEVCIMAEQRKSVMAGPRMDRLPMTKTHYKSFFLIAGGSFFDGFDLYLAGGVLAAMAAGGFSSVTGNATFISFTFIGLYFGTLLAGYFGDRFGRKFAMKYTLLIYSAATCACALAPEFSHLVIYRAIAGFGLGGVIITGYTFWVELSPKNTRGFWFSALSFLVNLSQPLAALLALVVIPTYGWRSMFWIAGIPPILIWLLQLKFMPESPRWLEEQHRLEEAESALQQFEKGIPDLPLLTQTEIVREGEKTEQSAAEKKVSLWSPGIRKMTFLSIIISLLYLPAWFTFTAWVPTFFIKEGFSQVMTFGVTFFIMLGAIPGNILAAWVSDKFGRKKTIIADAVVLAFLSLLYGYSTNIYTMSAFGFAFIMGGNVLIAVIMGYIPELFPTSVRMMGASLANSFGRAGTIASPFMIAYLFNSGGKAAVFISSFIMYVIIAICVAILGRETTNKSLESIEKEVEA